MHFKPFNFSTYFPEVTSRRHFDALEQNSFYSVLKHISEQYLIISFIKNSNLLMSKFLVILPFCTYSTIILIKFTTYALRLTFLVYSQR